MAAPEGNDNAMLFKTSEERLALCERWCAWLREGKNKESFPDCDPQTFRAYCEKFPVDFDTKKIQAAERANLEYWENAGRQMMWMGGKDVSPSVWIFIMKNKFKWKDNVDVTTGGEKLDTLNGLLGSIAASKSGKDQAAS